MVLNIANIKDSPPISEKHTEQAFYSDLPDQHTRFEDTLWRMVRIVAQQEAKGLPPLLTPEMTLGEAAIEAEQKGINLFEYHHLDPRKQDDPQVWLKVTERIIRHKTDVMFLGQSPKLPDELFTLDNWPSNKRLIEIDVERYNLYLTLYRNHGLKAVERKAQWLRYSSSDMGFLKLMVVRRSKSENLTEIDDIRADHMIQAQAIADKAGESGDFRNALAGIKQLGILAGTTRHDHNTGLSEIVRAIESGEAKSMPIRSLPVYDDDDDDDDNED